MPTISEQLTQLTQDRDDLVTNLTTKGISGLTGDETFTELVPEVLNISGGGGTIEEVIQYVVAPYQEFTINSSDWENNQVEIVVNNTSYVCDTTQAQLGLPVLTTNNRISNQINTINAGLILVGTTANTNTTTYYIQAVDVPNNNIVVAIFGISARS